MEHRTPTLGKGAAGRFLLGLFAAGLLVLSIIMAQWYYGGLARRLPTQFTETLDPSCRLMTKLINAKPEDLTEADRVQLCTCRKQVMQLSKYAVYGDINEQADCTVTVGNWVHNNGTWQYVTFHLDPLALGGSTAGGVLEPPPQCLDYCPETDSLSETGICAMFSASNERRADDPVCIARSDPTGCTDYTKPDGTEGLLCPDDGFLKFAELNPEEARRRCLEDPDFILDYRCTTSGMVTEEEQRQAYQTNTCEGFANGENQGIANPRTVCEFMGCGNCEAVPLVAPSCCYGGEAPGEDGKCGGWQNPSPTWCTSASAPVSPTEAADTDLVIEEAATFEPMILDFEPSGTGPDDAMWVPQAESTGTDSILPPEISTDPLPGFPTLEVPDTVPTWADPGPWIDPPEGWQPSVMADVTAGLDGKPSGLWHRVVSAVRSFFQLFQ